MNSVLQEAADLLKSRKFQPTFTEDGETLLVRCCGEALFWTTTVDTSEDKGVVTLLSRVPAKVPPAKRAQCAKLLAEVNYGKRQGAFHMDLRDGEVLFCVSNGLTGGIASEEILDALFGITYSAMNEHAPKIVRLVFGGAPAVQVESGSTDRHRSLKPPGLTN